MLSFKEYMNEIKSRFSDQAKSEVQGVNRDLVFKLDGKLLEFKSENEKNPKDPEHNFFTYEEALACQRDGWRLPTKEECKALLKKEYIFGHGKGIFDGRLSLPAAGYRDYDGNVHCIGSHGIYWSSTPYGSGYAWHFNFNVGGAYMNNELRWYGQSVRLVRDIK